jgi:hypothetical protein
MKENPRACALLASMVFASCASAQTVTFADTAAGSAPKDFQSALTGTGKCGQ